MSCDPKRCKLHDHQFCTYAHDASVGTSLYYTGCISVEGFCWQSRKIAGHLLHMSHEEKKAQLEDLIRHAPDEATRTAAMMERDLMDDDEAEEFLRVNLEGNITKSDEYDKAEEYLEELEGKATKSDE